MQNLQNSISLIGLAMQDFEEAKRLKLKAKKYHVEAMMYENNVFRLENEELIEEVKEHGQWQLRRHTETRT